MMAVRSTSWLADSSLTSTLDVSAEDAAPDVGGSSLMSRQTFGILVRMSGKRVPLRVPQPHGGLVNH